MGVEPTLAEIVREALESRLLDVWTAAVCRVEKYTPGTPPTVDALPMVRRALPDTAGGTQHEDLPVLPNVPVLFPHSAAFSGTWPLVPGDFVLVIFCASAIGNWRETGDVSDPGDLRRHDLSHGIAIPGVAPKGTTLPTDPTATIFETSAHVQIGAAASEFVVLADKMVTAFNAHVHATAGTGPPSTPTTPITAAAIQAIKLKSE